MTSEAASHRTSRAVVRLRFVSDLGTFLNLVVLISLTERLTASPIAVGVLLSGRVFGGLLASLIARWVVRVPTRRALLAVNLVRASALLAVSVAPDEVVLPVAVGAAFLMGWGGSMLAIGVNQQLPGWIGGDRLPVVNGQVASAAALGAVTGSFLGGGLLATIGDRAALATNGGVFVVAAALTWSLPQTAAMPVVPRSGGGVLERMRTSVRGEPVLVLLMVVAMFDTLGSAAHNVGFAFLATDLDANRRQLVLGVLLGTWAAGKFVGSQLTGRLLRGRRPDTVEATYLIGVAAMSASFIVTFWSPNLALVIVPALAAGLADGVGEVALVTRVQALDAPRRLSFLSAFTFMHMTGFGIGMLLVAPFFAVWSPAVTVTMFHGLPLLAVGVAAACRRTLRPAQVST